MSTAPTDLDFVAAILVLIILVVSALTLFGMGILMAVGAVFSKRPLVTSWPSDQEHSFAAFEHRGTMSSSQAWVLSLLGAVGLTIFATGVYFGVAPDRKDMTKDMNMSNLTKKRPAAPPKAEAAPPAEAPKPDTPAPAPATPKQ
ncbi:MAG TPA: hypothetical protein VLM79_35890 [Kofleriaceae bacterium]|nr:hypothetical protein [Kofleriaceae bacterium]